jgi:hypothetical protein
MTLALAFRKRHDDHGPVSVPGRLAPSWAADACRRRLLKVVAAGTGRLLLPLWLRMQPFEWPVWPGSARSAQRRAKAMLNRGSPALGPRHENAFRGQATRLFGSHFFAA